MKKISFICMVLMTLGCSILGPQCGEYTFEHDIKVSNPDEAMQWIYKNVKWKGDDYSNGTEYFQKPEETYKWKTGDCNDFVILHMYLCHEMGYETWLYAINRTDNIRHAISKIDNMYYDVVGNKKSQTINKIFGYQSIIGSRTYSECMSYIGKNHEIPNNMKKYIKK